MIIILLMIATPLFGIIYLLYYFGAQGAAFISPNVKAYILLALIYSYFKISSVIQYCSVGNIPSTPTSTIIQLPCSAYVIIGIIQIAFISYIGWEKRKQEKKKAGESSPLLLSDLFEDVNNNNASDKKLMKDTHNSDYRHQRSTQMAKALAKNLSRNLNEEELDTKLDSEIKLIATDSQNFPILSTWEHGVLKATIRSMVKKGYDNNPSAVGSAMTMLEMDLQHERAASKGVETPEEDTTSGIYMYQNEKHFVFIDHAGYILAEDKHGVIASGGEIVERGKYICPLPKGFLSGSSDRERNRNSLNNQANHTESSILQTLQARAAKRKQGNQKNQMSKTIPAYNPNDFPTLAQYPREQIEEAVQKLMKEHGMTRQQCLVNLEMDLHEQELLTKR